MEEILAALLAYLISLAANLRNEAISESRREKLSAIMKETPEEFSAIRNYQSLRQQLRLLGTRTASLMQQMDARTPGGKPAKYLHLFLLHDGYSWTVGIGGHPGSFDAHRHEIDKAALSMSFEKP